MGSILNLLLLPSSAPACFSFSQDNYPFIKEDDRKTTFIHHKLVREKFTDAHNVNDDRKTFIHIGVFQWENLQKHRHSLQTLLTCSCHIVCWKYFKLGIFLRSTIPAISFEPVNCCKIFSTHFNLCMNKYLWYEC